MSMKGHEYSDESRSNYSKTANLRENRGVL